MFQLNISLQIYEMPTLPCAGRELVIRRKTTKII